MNEWMTEWVVKWVDGWMGGAHGWLPAWLVSWVAGWTVGWLSGYLFLANKDEMPWWLLKGQPVGKNHVIPQNFRNCESSTMIFEIGEYQGHQRSSSVWCSKWTCRSRLWPSFNLNCNMEDKSADHHLFKFFVISIAIYWWRCLCFTTDNPPPPFWSHLLIISRLLGISTPFLCRYVKMAAILNFGNFPLFDLSSFCLC